MSGARARRTSEAADPLAAARELLRELFGHDAFRPGQAEVIAAALAGEDVLAVMPTGGGKSLTYQLPALLAGGLTLVVSPLIALMRDQVRQMKALHVPAETLNSETPDLEGAAIWRRVMAGEIRLLYVSPERLMLDDFLAALADRDVARLVVDEAHCVSHWGHDFRTEYRALARARRALGEPPVTALTATADAETRADIVRTLFRGKPRLVVTSFDRPNLFLGFRRKHAPRSAPWSEVTAFVTARRGLSGIVYCAARSRTEKLAEHLGRRGVRALAYHAGLEAETRRRREEVFMREPGIVMVATIAFGLGIDKPDVRYVVHADLPGSIEAYYHEIGRAGRDGAPAEALALFSAADLRCHRRHLAEKAMSPRRRAVEVKRLDAMLALTATLGCRRRLLLKHFGEKARTCGQCDRCVGRVHLGGWAVDVLRPALAMAHAVKRAAGRS